jgi:hypothetical protein
MAALLMSAIAFSRYGSRRVGFSLEIANYSWENEFVIKSFNRG